MKDRSRIRACAAMFVAALLVLPGFQSKAGAADWTTDGGPDGTGFIQAPHFKTHSLRWSTKISDLPSGIFPMSPLLTFGGRVIVNGAGTNSVLALDAKTGEVVWRFQPDPRHTGSFGGYPNANQPFIANGIYYTTANNGFLYALDAKTGKKIWSYQVTGTDYNKTIARVAVCGGRVFFDTLGGIPSKGQKNVYAVDAKSGMLLWSVYSGADDWPGELVWPDFRKDPASGENAALARNTRRFEARPGLACFGNRVQIPGEDGVLELLDVTNGAVRGQYNALHASSDLGYQVDGAVGITDPKTGDLLRTFLNNRLIRLVPSEIETQCGGRICTDNQQEQLKVHPAWRHPDGDCSSTHNCGVVSAARGQVLPTYTSSRNDGIIGGAVFSAGFSIADWEDGRRVVYAPNHDGYIYRVNWDNPTDPSVFMKIPMEATPDSLRDAVVSQRPDNENLYTAGANEAAAHCLNADNCKNGPWEHRASNVSSPLVAGGAVYVADSFAHKMKGYDWKTGAEVFSFEVKWDDKAQYPPFGDTKPKPIVDLDELVQVTPAHDGANLYFSANNGVVYAFSTQETIKTPRKNLAILGSGIVPFIPKWTEQMGAFDYVWTPEGDWYHPSYTSTESLTAKQAPVGFPGSTTPFGYKGASLSTSEFPWTMLMAALLLLAFTVQRSFGTTKSHALSLSTPLLLGSEKTLIESLEKAAELRRRNGL